MINCTSVGVWSEDKCFFCISILFLICCCENVWDRWMWSFDSDALLALMANAGALRIVFFIAMICWKSVVYNFFNDSYFISSQLLYYLKQIATISRFLWSLHKYFRLRCFLIKVLLAIFPNFDLISSELVINELPLY